MTASAELPTALCDETASREFFRRAAERVRALPGVREAAFSSDLPWSHYDENASFSTLVACKTTRASSESPPRDAV